MSSPGQGEQLSPSEERTWSMIAHIGSLVAAWFAMGFLCPLVVWLLYRDRSAFVRRHAAESLNFQLSLLIYLAVAGLLALVTLGLALVVVIPVVLFGAIAALVFIILATVAASNGRDYRYPLTIRMVK